MIKSSNKYGIIFFLALVLFANKGFCSSLYFVDEFNGHLDSLRIYATASAMASLRMGEEDEKLSSLSVTHESKIEPISKASADAADMIKGTLWQVQRGIEKLLEENHPFETFKAVVHSLKRFGDEIENPDFWAMAGQIYLETEIDLSVKGYEGENHWKTWFRIHFSGTKTPIVPGKEDVLGCLLYPVRFTVYHCRDNWKCNTLLFYLQANSASYGNAYARLGVIDFLKRRAGDDEEEFGSDILNTSTSPAIVSPFDKAFVREKNDMNRFLWAAFADNHFKRGYHYVPDDKVSDCLGEDIKVLQQMTINTPESEYRLGIKLLGIDDLVGAELALRRSMERGFLDAHRVLYARFDREKYKGFVEEKIYYLVDSETILIDTYKEVFGIEI